MKHHGGIREYENFMKSREGLEQQLSEQGGTDITLIKAIQALDAKQHKAEWDNAIQEKKLEAKTLGIEITDQALKTGAEDVLVHKLITPPHWKQITDCENCGVVPCEEKNGKCRWCTTKVSSITSQKDLRPLRGEYLQERIAITEKRYAEGLHKEFDNDENIPW